MLITDEYRKEQERLHENPGYGVASVSFAPMVTHLINTLQIDEMLDYGAGKGRLAKSITPDRKVMIELYDPAMPDYCEEPEPREFVTCIDVLEHIEPDCLDDVLDDLQRVTKRFGFFTIHTGPAVKILSDGRNAHLTQENYKWWMPKIWERFHIHQMTHTPHGFTVLVKANGSRQLCESESGNH
jgi:2-polyprenyl-3-methyl-5-hydroxy-6-metoxy-1,4-benzoquinol methylase